MSAAFFFFARVADGFLRRVSACGTVTIRCLGLPETARPTSCEGDRRDSRDECTAAADRWELAACDTLPRPGADQSGRRDVPQHVAAASRNSDTGADERSSGQVKETSAE